MNRLRPTLLLLFFLCFCFLKPAHADPDYGKALIGIGLVLLCMVLGLIFSFLAVVKGKKSMVITATVFAGLNSIVYIPMLFSANSNYDYGLAELLLYPSMLVLPAYVLVVLAWVKRKGVKTNWFTTALWITLFEAIFAPVLKELLSVVGSLLLIRIVSYTYSFVVFYFFLRRLHDRMKANKPDLQPSSSVLTGLKVGLLVGGINLLLEVQQLFWLLTETYVEGLIDMISYQIVIPIAYGMIILTGIHFMYGEKTQQSGLD